MFGEAHARRTILAEAGAARLAGIAAFRSLLLQEAGFGVSGGGDQGRSLSLGPLTCPSFRRGMAGQTLVQALLGTFSGFSGC